MGIRGAVEGILGGVGGNSGGFQRKLGKRGLMEDMGLGYGEELSRLDKSLWVSRMGRNGSGGGGGHPDIISGRIMNFNFIEHY